MKDCVLRFYVTKIHRRIKVDCTEYFVQLCTVVSFDGCKCSIDFLTNFRVFSIIIKEAECRLFVHNKSITTHRALDSFFIAVISFAIFSSLFCVNVTQVFHEQHRKNIVLISRTIDFTSKTIACLPKYRFNILFRRHLYLPSFTVLYIL